MSRRPTDAVNAGRIRRAQLAARGLTAHGTPWKIMPPALAEEHAAVLREVADNVAEFHPIAARRLRGVAGDLEQHADPSRSAS